MTRPKPKQLPPRPTQPPKAPPVASGAEAGEAMPLSHATAYALHDLAAWHNTTPHDAAEYAIGLWHWISGKQKEGWRPCMADPNDEVYPVELPAPKIAT